VRERSNGGGESSQWRKQSAAHASARRGHVLKHGSGSACAHRPQRLLGLGGGQQRQNGRDGVHQPRHDDEAKGGVVLDVAPPGWSVVDDVFLDKAGKDGPGEQRKHTVVVEAGNVSMRNGEG